MKIKTIPKLRHYLQKNSIYHFAIRVTHKSFGVAQPNAFELSYMKSIYAHYLAFTAGKLSRDSMIFDNSPQIIGKASTNIKPF